MKKNEAKLYQMIMTDRAAQSTIVAASNEPDRIKAIVQMGKAHGLSVTSEAVAAFVEKKPNGELSDMELETVVGGKGSIHDFIEGDDFWSFGWLTGNYDDELDGGDGNDTMYGYKGDDTLYGGQGNDSLDGGEGDDQLWGEQGNNTISGGTGDDYIHVLSGDNRLDGDDGDDSINAAGGNDTMNGGSGNDWMSGNGGDDTMSGGFGNDTMYAGSGEDTMDGGLGNDSMDGGSGDDSMDGGFGNDVMYGGSSSIWGSSSSSGDDTMSGGQGNDALYGQDGDDILDGGTGHDILTGGSGADVFVFGNNDDTNTVTDFNPAEDSLKLEGIENPDDMEVFSQAGNTFISYGGTTIILEGIELDREQVWEHVQP